MAEVEFGKTGQAAGDARGAERRRAFLEEKKQKPKRLAQKSERLITDFQTRFEGENVAVSVLLNICPDLPLDRFKSQADVCKLLLSGKQL